MTPNERNFESLYYFLDEKINELTKIKKNISYSYLFNLGSTTTSDKLAIRKLRLKK